MKLSLVESSKAPTFATYEVDPSAFFLTYDVGIKDGLSFIPGELRPCGPVCSNHGRARKMDCGGGVAHRLNENVVSLSALTLDIDDKSVFELGHILDVLRVKGLSFYWWHTHGHSPPKKCKARIVIPFTQDVPVSSAEWWSGYAWGMLVEAIGLSSVYKGDLDTQCRNAARIYYLPRKPSADSTHEAGFEPGVALDWTGVLTELTVPPKPKSTYVDPPLDESRPVDLERLRGLLNGFHKEPEKTILGRLARGEALMPPPSRRGNKGTSRNEAWQKASWWLPRLAEGWESPEALLALLRPSWEAEDAEGEDPTPWETVERLFEGGYDRAPEYRAEQAEKIRFQNATRLAVKNLNDTRPGTRDGTPPDEAEPVEYAEDDASEEWRAHVQWKPSKIPGQAPELKTVIDNISPILALHPEWCGRLRYNEFLVQTEIWENGKGRAISDLDVVHMNDWLSRTFNFKVSDNQVGSRAHAAAALYSYDPLKEWLLKCAETPTFCPGALDTWLIDLLHARTEDDDGNDLTPYLKIIGRKFLISAVARALNPGCKVDTMLTLVGRQGAKKSQAVAMLANFGQFFISGGVSLTGDRDSLAKLSKNWLIELAELDGVTKAQVSAQRNTLSTSEDDFRPPYAKHSVKYKRRSIFVGTTNEYDFLTDSAGNRRHWVVEVGDIDLSTLSACVSALWSEAVAAYQTGEGWWLEEEEHIALHSRQNQNFREGDAIAEALQAFVLKLDPDKRPKWVSSHTIVTDWLGLEPHQTRSRTVSNALRVAGFRRKFVKDHGVPRRGYLLPPELLAAPKEGRNLRVVPLPTPGVDAPHPT